MSELSMSTLSMAIRATAAERSRLLERIAREPAEVDEDEHLSEQVMDMDRALGELGTAYEALRAGRPGYPSFDALAGD